MQFSCKTSLDLCELKNTKQKFFDLHEEAQKTSAVKALKCRGRTPHSCLNSVSIMRARNDERTPPSVPFYLVFFFPGTSGDSRRRDGGEERKRRRSALCLSRIHPHSLRSRADCGPRVHLWRAMRRKWVTHFRGEMTH